MISHLAPEWLEEFEARFGSVLRTPLDRSSGTLRATPAAYDRSVGAIDGPRARAQQRLAVYNRQYWFRLLTVFQETFPLTTRLLGHWRFNDYAARFLLESPPRGWDIERASDGFEAWLAEQSDVVPSPAVIEAARIDAAWRRVFLAAPHAPYRPAADDAARLLDSVLVPSPAVARVEEHWELVELRRTLTPNDGEAPIALPPRHAEAHWWALVQRPEGVAQIALETREAELFRLLETHTVADALAHLEAACSEQERIDLPARTQRWLARSVALDFWIGLRAAVTTDTSHS